MGDHLGLLNEALEAPDVAQRGYYGSMRSVGRIVPQPRREGMTAACLTIYEKRVSSLVTNGPESKMQRQLVSTMQS